MPRTILCLASYEKGAEFLRESKRQGWHVVLLTVTALEEAAWPRESIDEFFAMPDLSRLEDVINAVAYLARSRDVARIVALDEYDVPTAAALREHLRLPGMGMTQARTFRDKLAMRDVAHSAGVPVPDFVPVVNHERIHRFTERVAAPWVLKPRQEVSTIGIEKLESAEALWVRIDELGDLQSHFVLERFVPGEVFHVDSIVWDGRVLFSPVHQYGRPPLAVFHGGGIALSRTIRRGSEDERALQALNRDLLAALGMWRGVTHAEFIRGQDGGHYFLEIGARVGGAHIAEMIEAATGVNLWREWARIEAADEHGQQYHLPEPREDYGAVMISLARQEQPDTSTYDAPEIVWRMEKPSHVGFILASEDPDRIEDLLAEYTRRIGEEFLAALPPWEGRPEVRP
jgi:biotin carboxylase